MTIIGHEEELKWKKFQEHWLEICKKIESIGVSKRDEEYWRETFKSSRDTLKFELLDVIGSLNREYRLNHDAEVKNVLDIISEIYRFNDNFNISLQVGRYKYRNNERINLKEHYGFVGDLIYIIRKLVGRI